MSILFLTRCGDQDIPYDDATHKQHENALEQGLENLESDEQLEKVMRHRMNPHAETLDVRISTRIGGQDLLHEPVLEKPRNSLWNRPRNCRKTIGLQNEIFMQPFSTSSS